METIKILIEKYKNLIVESEKLQRKNPYSGYYAAQQDSYEMMVDDLEEILNSENELGVSNSSSEHGDYARLENGMRSDKLDTSSELFGNEPLENRIDSEIITYHNECNKCGSLFWTHACFWNICPSCDKKES